MSHPEQLAFVELCTAVNRDLVAGSRVLEIGSFDVNGSTRALFRPSRSYCGVDLVPGPGVNRISYGHELDDPDASWDITLSAECFEHDPHWRLTLANMVRLTRPGGLVIVTCASRGRVEHGTRRTAASDSPGTQFEGLDYYRNIGLDELHNLPLGLWFDEYRSWYNPVSCDLNLVGVRTREGGQGSKPEGVLPAPSDIHALNRLMPLHLRAVRWPLRGLSRAIPDEDRYQKWAVPYWLRAVRLMGLVDRALRASRLKGNTQSAS